MFVDADEGACLIPVDVLFVWRLRVRNLSSDVSNTDDAGGYVSLDSELNRNMAGEDH